ncbi:hypothetical protein PIB30_058423 [Stylosanthes scabra]|uniref:Uncharacterized protein n=1 Tax=Stylosanthes scabra TaxID=79078 RepID=A0ABU6VN37_9FABA|nr:hypothetical protein [Stylosanthes scabra]
MALYTCCSILGFLLVGYTERDLKNTIGYVLFASRSSLVKGACGVGLGLSCQDLLTRVEAADSSTVENEANMVPESELLGKIVTALATVIRDGAQSSFAILDSLCSCFPPGSDE